MTFQPVKRFAVLISSLCLLAACAATPGSSNSMSSGGGYSQGVPLCSGASDCAAKMTAARAWITETLGLALFIDNDTRLETHGYGMAEFTAVRVDRVAGPGDSASLRAQVHCGEDLARFASLGCPDTATAIAEFNRAVSAAF